MINVYLEIQGGVDEILHIQRTKDRSKEHNTILNWLTPAEYSTQQMEFIRQREPRTGQWLLG
jgi:hypothetical protein